MDINTTTYANSLSRTTKMGINDAHCWSARQIYCDRKCWTLQVKLLVRIYLSVPNCLMHLYPEDINTCRKVRSPLNICLLEAKRCVACSQKSDTPRALGQWLRGTTFYLALEKLQVMLLRTNLTSSGNYGICFKTFLETSI